jgi:hypothetical protein
MDDNQVGYKRPPAASRFKKGVCPNPAGRGKREPLAAGKIFNEAINSSTQVTSGGRTRRIPRMTLLIQKHVRLALKGNIKSAELLLDIHSRSQKHGDFEIPILFISEAKALVQSSRNRK